MSFRNSASFGKRQEFAAIAKLLSLGFDVYETMVDDQGIDCVIRIPRDNDLRYLDIQIKARSKNVNPKNAGLFGWDQRGAPPLRSGLSFFDWKP